IILMREFAEYGVHSRSACSRTSLTQYCSYPPRSHWGIVWCGQIKEVAMGFQFGKIAIWAVAAAPLLLGACASQDAVNKAQQTADAAKTEADQAMSTAQQALSAAQAAQQTANQAESTAQAASQKADMMYQKSLRK
ncbi:MAG TPA: Lpp/OprI family alanine-zipper lipoprotein, partial [Stellaceae bacterium]|nr:Lpp/OprI family alanine-zipper lipoprotein [Stellaceae bacterium]